MQITPTVKQLLIINVLFFLGTLWLGDQAYAWLSLFYFEHPQYHPWQFLTHMFMHGNLMHIFFNMWLFVMLGAYLENIWGAKRFFIFYLVCAMGSFALYNMIGFIEIMNCLS